MTLIRATRHFFPDEIEYVENHGAQSTVGIRFGYEVEGLGRVRYHFHVSTADLAPVIFAEWAR